MPKIYYVVLPTCPQAILLCDKCMWHYGDALFQIGASMPN